MQQGICHNLTTGTQLGSVTENIVDFAAATGILMKLKGTPKESKLYTHVPFTLFPTPVPRESLSFLLDIQPDINRLMHLVSQDEDYMTKSLQGVLEADDFAMKLFEIYKSANACGASKDPVFGCLRSDYMFDFDDVTQTSKPKQVEINTMAAGLVALGTQKMKLLHAQVLTEVNLPGLISALPDNFTAKTLAQCFVSAWKLYGNRNAVVVFLVSEIEWNIFDQRLLEYEIADQDPSIPIRRVVFDSLASNTQVKEDRRLFINNEEVAVVYFRAGYSPSHYNEGLWEARLQIEKSKAIKSPSVAHQLVGMKKLQEILARPGQVERFVGEEAAEKIRKTFAGLYTLDMNEDGDAAVKAALSHPEKYVLKPQREGGGNNFYDDDLAKLLKEIGGDSRRCAYILMDKICPKATRNYMVSGGVAKEADTVSELGIFSAFLAVGSDFKENNAAGTLLRTKSLDNNDGGLSSGLSVMDSPLPVDQ